MQSKDVRNAIISLIILVAGIFIIIQAFSGLLTTKAVSASGIISGGLASSVQSMGMLFIIGCSALVVLLLPLYIYVRGKEKDAAERQRKLEQEKRMAEMRQRQLLSERMQERSQQQQSQGQQQRYPHQQRYPSQRRRRY